MTPMGRPKLDNPKDVQYSIRLDAETNRRLQVFCDKEKITKGEAIRRGLELLLKEEK